MLVACLRCYTSIFDGFIWTCLVGVTEDWERLLSLWYFSTFFCICICIVFFFSNWLAIFVLLLYLSFIFLFEVGWSGVCPGGSGGGHRLLLYPVSPHRTTSYTLQSIDMFPKYTKNTQEIHKKYTNTRKKHKHIWRRKKHQCPLSFGLLQFTSSCTEFLSLSLYSSPSKWFKSQLIVSSSIRSTLPFPLRQNQLFFTQPNTTPVSCQSLGIISIASMPLRIM